MKVGCPFPLLAAAFLGGVLAPAFVHAQTTVDVNSVTRVSDGAGGYTYATWKPVLGPTGGAFTSSNGYLMDPVYDQQTGQGDSDFVSSTTGGVANPGFFIQFGQVNGVDVLAFRIMMNEYKTTGNLVNIRFGLEGNDGDGGKADLFLGLSQQSNQNGLVFQAPGTGANTSPSSTTLGNAFVPAAQYYSGGVRSSTLPALNANGNAIAVNSTNFSNVAIGDGVNKDKQGGQGVVIPDNRATYYPGWATQYEASAVSNNSPINLDSMITYAIPIADINAALASLGETWTVTPTRLMRWIAVTATQNNSVNQDAYGTDKAGFSNTYASFLPLMDSYGNPVPEPSTYGLLLGAGLVGFLGLRRRARASTARAV
jgi:hypothetical protein